MRRVVEDGSISYPDSGSPQGGVVSPILSNVFLHYVLDLWFEHEVKPRLRRRAYLIRYADDFVIGHRDHHDAQRVMDVVPKRFGKYGLTVHPTKTKLVPFRPPPSTVRKVPRADRPGTFDLLGFTHYWSRSRRGYWVVKLKTASDRFSRAVRSIDLWCRKHRHLPLSEQRQKLNEKLRGHYAYYGVTGNSEALSRFLWETRASMAEVAYSPQPRAFDDLGRVPSSAPAILAGPRSHLTFNLRACSETMI